jgi:serine/threonine protein kinase
LQETSHPFTVRYIEEFLYRGKNLCIVTNFANGGDFESFMKKKKEFFEQEALYYLTMLLIAVEYLQSKGIFHRDLKPSNILIETYPNGYNIL